ncbi:DUF982 domain-containing protein [Falsirhodobacter sp. 20TX0035]|uniref:DUF982 domain-containing protein n=1 Tax=Falsirhodobacter sp. 20TX0035 TaxID=3022019 RepID=UPI00232D56A0|nr:DUF982 domain-containing protein [Falsirhodobacter sp. 20TX0035]MDB6454999.1 DUF982 domain-containing protein [Falsirhodobacter sp. 20TX0035]
MSHVWEEPIAFANPETGTFHIIRATGHALIFLTESWLWGRSTAYYDAVARCTAAFEASECQDDARDAFLAALISAGLLDRLPEAVDPRRRSAS